jgi:hypothetical protein
MEQTPNPVREDEIELVVRTRRFSIWACRTSKPLEAVLAPHFFDDVVRHGMRKNDRISILANAGHLHAEQASLTVTDVNHGEVAVALLWRGSKSELGQAS